ncbi:serine hydrolase domain-containing protein [Agrococcus sp. ProA11]|uniref:serine hydrolase domain-containing protein n=1 Tax=Agrococcus chionoecetis TaxID=3153752 RepID=UPI00326149B8
MSGTQLQAAADAVVRRRADGQAPAAAVLAIAEGDDVHAASAGVADLELGEHASLGHAQDLASVSKVLTTLAVQALASRGELAMESTLGEMLGARAGEHRDATVDDLLRHRGGMRPWWPLYLDPTAVEDPVAAGLALAPAGQPGAARRYSDLGMQALGAVVQAVAGAPFADAVGELVLAPLAITSVTPGAPRDAAPTLTGPDGDAIEQSMVRTGRPYPVDVDDTGFGWRSSPVRRSIADGNAFHAFRGAAGHAGWFGDVDGLLRLAGALAVPAMLGISPRHAQGLRIALDPGQGQGVRHYRVRWRGRDRLLIGHPGFTGAFVGAAAASGPDPALRIALLCNRLHGQPAPTIDHLVDVERLWRSALAEADTILHPTTGGRP